MIWTENKIVRNPSDFDGNQKSLIKYYSICEKTSESGLQTILELCNITLNNLYLLVNCDLGANFCKIRRLEDSVLQFCNVDRD